MTEDEKLRLKCLDLAVRIKPSVAGSTWVIQTAKEFERHVKHAKPS